MTMADGMKSRVMEMYGRRREFPATGRRTATDTGFMYLPGDGPGSKTSRGDSRRSTMAAGHSYRAAGAGSPDQLPWSQSTRQHWLHSLAVVGSALELELVAEWDGSRWGQGKC